MSRQPNGGFIGKENITDNTNASGVYTLSDVTQKVADNEFPTARYTPSRSLRFSAARSTYLSRTPASAGNRKTWTFSCWIKRGTLDGAHVLLEATSNGTTDRATNRFSSDAFNGGDSSSGLNYTTTQVFRDSSSWYHMVIAMDTTQATASNRFKLFVNETQITSFSDITYPTLNADTLYNSTSHFNYIGATQPVFAQYFDGYMAEVNFVDGQALDPASFGEYEERTGEWKAKRYAGTYGTNGFYLSFANNSSTSALGLDDATGIAGSGAGSNDWTTNNFSLATGADYDSMVDVPGVGSSVINDTGGVVRGNYCTWDPLVAANFTNTGTMGSTIITFSNGNLNTFNSVNAGFATRMQCWSTIGMTTGKWYAEFTNLSNMGVGISKGPIITGAGSGIDSTINYNNGGVFSAVNGAFGTQFGTALSANSGDIIGVTVDLDNNIITWYKNGVEMGGFTSIGTTSTLYETTRPWFFFRSPNSSADSSSIIANFGQQPFAYSPPTGFKTLCTTNLPEPVIKRPVDHFDVKLWTGNGTGQTIGNTARERDNYEISRSLRFNLNDSNHLIRTPAVAGNRKTWTWSGWVKRGNINANGTLFAARTGVGATYLTMVLSSLSDFRMESNSETSYPLYKTNALFSDPAAWYHFVVALDMTQATSTHRLKVYVNGVLQTTASFNVPAQNTDLAVNSTETHLIGQQASGNYFDGYLTEINFVDGQALEPESFGQFDVDGSWQAKRYTGTYGTNGFYLQFNQEELQNVSADFLVVAGGGGGNVAGGGAGGYRTSAGTSGGGASAESAFSLSTNNARYRITVGAGGAGQVWPNAQNEATQRGSVSVFGIITSNGGGGGGGSSDNGFSGGSGGGSGISGAGAAGIAGQGFTGGSGTGASYTPAGGGGAGAAGGNFTGGQSGGTPGSGGSGVASSITGSSVTRAGGGGASTSGYFGQGPAGAGGAGGGGGGGSGGGAGTVGTANTGGGGGGGSLTNAGNAIGAGANGGSGIIIVKIPNTHTATFSAGVTSSLSTSVTGFNIYTVTATSTTSETVAFNPV